MVCSRADGLGTVLAKGARRQPEEARRVALVATVLRTVGSTMRTLVDLLAQSVRDWEGYPAVARHGSEPLSWSYGELGDASRRIATYLRVREVERGDRVILWAVNGPEWVVAFFGIQLLGAIAVPLDVRCREDLLCRIEEQTEPKQLILGREQAEQLTQPHVEQVIIEELPDVLSTTEPLVIDSALIDPSDIAEVMFTSGTTGHPKGVMLTHHNIVTNVEMARTAVMPAPKYRVLSILPLSHMYEQVGGLLTPISGGASITYPSSLRPDSIFAAMVAARATNMCCVPQVLQLFRQGIERELRRQGREQQFARLHALARRLPFGSRRLVFRAVHARMGGAFDFFLSGGAYLDPDLGRWWEGLGIKVLQGYGMTEAAPIVTTSTLDDRDVASVGRPLPGISIRFTDEQEILLRGDNITPGYWRDTEATAAAFEDGWYRSGDLGYLDRAGRLHLQGRKKDLIVLGNGMNVYPEDVERVLAAESGVRGAVVLGTSRGQDIEVHSVLLLDEATEAEAIVKRANLRLAPHQQIRRVTVWPEESFPMTPTLKVKRADVIARLAEAPQQRGPVSGPRNNRH